MTGIPSPTTAIGLPRAAPVTPEARDRLRGLPHSARTVFDTLEKNGPLTHKDLLAATGMPGRTVRYAVSRLKDAGIIGARCNLMDCRQCYFFVVGECPGQGRSPFVKTGWRAL